MKTLLLGLTIATIGILPTVAQSYREFPAPIPGYPFQRSVRTGAALFIPPYERPFTVRVYTTPPQQPYYNVPPYAVVSPY